MRRLTCPQCEAELEIDFTLRIARVAPGPWRLIPLNDLPLSARPHNVLRNLGVLTAGEVNDMSNGELLRARNFGRRSLNEVREVLAYLKARKREET